MYIPSGFAETDLHKLHDFIQQHSFATLVSGDGAEKGASHLPFLLKRDSGSQGQLIGHMARANRQWEQAQNQPVLVIFTGPHAYISPTWYEETNVVPTWNYLAVHVYGTLRLVTDRDSLLEIVRRSVDYYESAMEKPWTTENAEADFIDGLLEAIVGFTIQIDRIEGKWKLSQNLSLSRRERVIHALKQSDDPGSAEIAELVSQTLQPDAEDE